MGLNLSPLPGQSEFGVVVTGFEIEMLKDPAIARQIHDLKGMAIVAILAFLAVDRHARPIAHALMRAGQRIKQ